MEENNKILTKEEALEKMHRMALEIAESIEDEKSLLFIGIKNSGMVIASKIAEFLKNYIQIPISIAQLKFDKEDLRISNIQPEINITDQEIILVDDVSNSGRTLLYALKPLLEFLPKKIQTLVMVERMHKIYPVKSDFVGLSIATTKNDFVKLSIEKEEVVGAYIISNN
ncbi:phosphoribosyltransferase family protein [Rhizosphaericola mali]|uniref:Phosphoribosyltransferase n=1 Tax=Rhizosphaericola mali TaxID=2545455 RepID=A0A5P2G904_9BACT|nr:phosphoribosyltransferase family protein [Rhizosphaericola mali]QES90789.1 phosphoribosyltransferase [Rhizosphaericola mali]